MTDRGTPTPEEAAGSNRNQAEKGAKYYRISAIRSGDGRLHIVSREPVGQRVQDSEGNNGTSIKPELSLGNAPVGPERFAPQEFDPMTPVERDLPPIEATNRH